MADARKYKLTNEWISIRGHRLFKIEAVKNFGSVRIGDLGGFIESEDNLSHYDNCWVDIGGMVFDKARIVDNAIVKEGGVVIGPNSMINKDIVVYGVVINIDCVHLDTVTVFERDTVHQYSPSRVYISKVDRKKMKKLFKGKGGSKRYPFNEELENSWMGERGTVRCKYITGVY